MRKKKLAALCAALILLAAAAAPVFYIAAIPVCDTAMPQSYSYQVKINCSGLVIPALASRVSLGVPLYIKQTYVQNGSQVSKGQKLFDVDQTKIAQIAQSGEDDNFSALEGTDYEKVVGALRALQDTKLSEELFPSSVYATDSGTISGFNLQDGTIVAANSTICSIKKGTLHQLRLTIPEDQLGFFTVGNFVIFSPIAYPDREYYGTINDTPANVRRQLTTTGYKNVADIYATVEQSDEYLTEGMSVTATVLSPSKKTLFIAPYESVGQDERGEYVYLAINGRAKKQYVTTGKELDHGLELKAGLSLSDRFVREEAKIKREGELMKFR
ncbi:MAG: hypothetical protein RSF90_03225 [Pygmaiobacter sp.]